MGELLQRYGRLCEPAAGVLLLGVWVLAATLGGAGARSAAEAVAVVPACGALAAARRLPAVAVSLAIVALLATVLLVGPEGDPTGYAVLYLAVVAAAARATACGPRRIGRWGLGTVLAVGPVIAVVGWSAAPGVLLDGADLVLRQTAVANTALLACCVAVAIWLVGRRAAHPAPRPAARVWWVDSGIAAVFFLLSLWWQGPEAARAVTLVFAVALVLRRRAPQQALALAWCGAFLQVLLARQSPGFDDVAVLMVLFACALHGDAVARWSALASAPFGALTATGFMLLGNGTDAGGAYAVTQDVVDDLLRAVSFLVMILIVLAFSWVLGLLERMRRRTRTSRLEKARAESEHRRAEERVVVEQERNRIARDMHDVVAHSLAVVIAQADGARYLGRSNPENLDEALVTIAQTARGALGDVRLLLAQLRHDESAGPQPGLADLDALVERMRAAGLAIRLEETGERARFGVATQIAAYRIVQEALTNALRHGDASAPVTVTLAFEPAGLRLSVANALRAPRAAAAGEGDDARDAHPPGHGLPGMSERATLAGGWARIREGDDMFRVSAFLPAAAESSGAL